MRTLFQFNTSAIDQLSGVDFMGQFNDALAEIEQSVHDELAKAAPGETFDVSWGEDGIVVSLTEEQAAREFGGPDIPLRPAVRTSLLKVAAGHHSRSIIS